MLWWLLTIGFVAIVMWILFAPIENGDGSAPLEVEEGSVPDAGVDAGVFVKGPGGELPGEGPLLVELRWLGGEADDRVLSRRPGSMTGLILGADGTPAVSTRVSVVGGPQDGLETVTGPDGRYLLEDLVPGTHYFALQRPGGTPVVRTQRVASRRRTSRDFQIGSVMEIPFLVVDGKEQPIAGARVATDLGAHEAVTGDDGVAWVSGIAGGQRVLVEVHAVDFVPVRYEMNLYAQLLSGEPIRLPALPTGATIRGQVRTWPGGPLPRVTLVPRASGPGPWSVAWEVWQDVEVDPNGFFEFKNLPLTHSVDVRVFHPFGVGSPSVRTVRPSVNATTTVEFLVKAGDAQVQGVVFGPDRQPLGGAMVVLEAMEPDKVLAALYPGLEESPLAVRLPVPAAVRREFRTGADGRFKFAVGDHPNGTGHLMLSASAEGCETARREVKRTTGSLELRLARLRLDGSLALTREDEGPIPNAIEWTLEGEALGSLGDTGISELAVGWYQVRARRGDQVLLDRQMHVSAGSRLDLSPQ